LSKSTDKTLGECIRRALEEEMHESALDINIYVKDGSVQLTGFVDVLSERITAERIAAGVPGVKRVANSITIGTEGYITDRHIERELEAKLYSGRYGNFDRVSVNVRDGSAVLMGTTANYAQNKQAEGLAAATRGVVNVVSNLRVENEGLYDDATLTGWAVQALSTADLSQQDIDVNVRNGDVTLSGWVRNREEVALAEELVSRVEGIRKVHNRLNTRA
jgi:osmotically-inducible protein OsmY